MYAPAEPPVRDGNARRCWDRQSGADARDRFAGNARGEQCLHFLAAAAEHEGIAALQPDDGLSLRCFFHEHFADLTLRGKMAAASLSHVDPLRLLRCGVQQGGIDQIVVDHDLTARQKRQTSHGDEICFSASGAHQKDLSRHQRTSFSYSFIRS